MKNLIPKKIKQVGILVGALLMILSVLPSNLLGVTKVNAESSQTEVNQELTNFQTELDSKLAQANKIYSQAQEAQEKVKDIFQKSINEKDNLKSNGRLARNIFDTVVMNQAKRLARYQSFSKETLQLITSEDIFIENQE